MVKVVSTKVENPSSPAGGGNPLMDIIGLGIMLLILLVVGVVVIKIFRHFFMKKKEMIDIGDKIYKDIYDDCITNSNELYFKKWLFGLIRIGIPITIRNPVNNNIDHIGKYVGSCYGKDGFYYILVNSSKRRSMGIFPKQFIVQCKVGKGEIETLRRSPDGKVDKVKLFMESSIIAEGSKGIQITCLGLEKLGDYYFPVLMDKEGNPVYDRSYIVNSMQDRFNIEAVNQVAMGWVDGMDKAVRMNPDGSWIKRYRGDSNIEQE